MDEEIYETAAEAEARRLYLEIAYLEWRKEKLVKEELALGVMHDKLEAFTGTEYFRLLPEEEKDLLQRQRTHMAGYRSALNGRLELLERKLS